MVSEGGTRERGWGGIMRRWKGFEQGCLFEKQALVLKAQKKMQTFF